MILRLYKETIRPLFALTNVQDMNLVIIQCIFIRTYPSAVTIPEGVTKICRLSGRTNIALVYEPKTNFGYLTPYLIYAIPAYITHP